MKRVLLCVLALAVLNAPAFFCVAGEKWTTITPLPDDVSLEPIPEGKPFDASLAKLSGAWQGELKQHQIPDTYLLGRNPDITIIVERAIGANVQAVLSLGPTQSFKGGWGRILGSVEGERLVFDVGPKRSKLSLRLRKDNSAYCEWELESGGRLYAHLDRRSGPATSNPVPTEEAGR